MGFILILVGIFLAPTVANEVTAAQGNFTGAAGAMWPLVTLMFVISIIGVGIGIVYNALKGTGA